ncbi:MAG: hypothetical protein Kow0069_14570 [Promethearchaeota archaeon]
MAIVDESWGPIDVAGWAAWLAVIGVHFAFAWLLARKAARHGRDLGLTFTNNYLYGTVGFFLLHGVCRILYFANDYYARSDALWVAGAIFGFISLVWLLNFVETSIVQKTRHGFTLLGAIGAALIVVTSFVSVDGARVVQYAFVAPLALIIPLFYLYAAVKSTGSVRRDSLVVLVGVICFEIGEATHTELLWELFPTSIYLSPLLMFAGLVMFYFGTIRTQT